MLLVTFSFSKKKDGGRRWRKDSLALFTGKAKKQWLGWEQKVSGTPQKSLNDISDQKKLGLLEKRLIDPINQEMSQMSPEYLVLPQSMKAITDTGIMPKRNRSQL